jgi:hypothetical protein
MFGWLLRGLSLLVWELNQRDVRYPSTNFLTGRKARLKYYPWYVYILSHCDNAMLILNYSYGRILLLELFISKCIHAE